MRREVEIIGTWNSDYSASGNDDEWGMVLQAMASKTLDLKPLITHRIPLRHAFEALNMMKNRTEFYAKVLIHPDA